MVQRTVGIDIGSFSIKIALLDRIGKNPQSWKIDTREVARKVLASSESAEAFRAESIEILSGLKNQGLLDGELIFSGMPGALAQTLRLEVPFQDERKLAAILPGLLAEKLPMDLASLAITWQVIGNANQPYALVSYAHKKDVEQHLSLLEESGIDPKHVVLSTAAGYFISRGELGGFADKLFSNADPKAASVFIDIGHLETNICIFNSTAPIAMRTMRKGASVITQALAEALKIPFEEAQNLKHKGIELYEDASGFSETELQVQKGLRSGLSSISLGLLQTLQSAGNNFDITYSSILLTGNGAQIKGLDKYIQKTVNIPTKTVCESAYKPQLLHQSRSNQLLGTLLENPGSLSSLGLVFASSLRKKQSMFDFRTGQFSWRGQYDFLKSKAKPLLMWSGLVIFSMLLGWTVKSSVLSSELAFASEEQQAFCEKLSGKKITSYRACRAILTDTESLASALPSETAADMFLEVSSLIPKDVKIKVTELDITDKALRISGTTDSFESIDSVVASLSKGKCIEKVEKGTARQRSGVIEFQVNAGINCQAAEEDEA